MIFSTSEALCSELWIQCSFGLCCSPLDPFCLGLSNRPNSRNYYFNHCFLGFSWRLHVHLGWKGIFSEPYAIEGGVLWMCLQHAQAQGEAMDLSSTVHIWRHCECTLFLPYIQHRKYPIERKSPLEFMPTWIYSLHFTCPGMGLCMILPDTAAHSSSQQLCPALAEVFCYTDLKQHVMAPVTHSVCLSVWMQTPRKRPGL